MINKPIRWANKWTSPSTIAEEGKKEGKVLVPVCINGNIPLWWRSVWPVSSKKCPRLRNWPPRIIVLNGILAVSRSKLVRIPPLINPSNLAESFPDCSWFSSSSGPSISCGLKRTGQPTRSDRDFNPVAPCRHPRRSFATAEQDQSSLNPPQSVYCPKLHYLHLCSLPAADWCSLRLGLGNWEPHYPLIHPHWSDYIITQHSIALILKKNVYKYIYIYIRCV